MIRKPNPKARREVEEQVKQITIEWPVIVKHFADEVMSYAWKSVKRERLALHSKLGTRIADLRKQLREEREETKRVQRQLADVLATIHRDGGELTTKHGFERSIAEARYIVAAALLDRERAQETDASLMRLRFRFADLQSLCRNVLTAIDSYNTRWSSRENRVEGPAFVAMRRAFHTQGEPVPTHDGE